LPGTDHGQTYGDWIAPKHDEALLVWPEASTLGEVARQNRAMLDAADHVTFAGTPLPELRRGARQFLGVGDGPVVMTGHQCELHHAGVWVKNAVIDAVASACDGTAVHVAVDTDAPKHLMFRWPGLERPLRASDDPRLHGVAWTAQLAPPTPQHLATLEVAAKKAADEGDISPLVGEFLADVRRYLIDQRDGPSPLNLPAAMADAQHKLDWSLGLRHGVMMLSGLLESPAWAAVVLELCRNATPFAANYNAALAEDRRAIGLPADADRPMPDLEVQGDRVELPFWFDDLTEGVRRRTFVEDGHLQADEPLDVAAASPMQFLLWCRRNRVRLAPRALALTLFARLVLCDLFVHGIGGGHYDRVLDRILTEHFDLTPPRFAVASATLLHPHAKTVERVCPACLVETQHRLAHDVLGDEKAAFLTKIATSSSATERRAAFDAMHAARHARLEDDIKYQDFLVYRAKQEATAREQEILFDRELFYLIQPELRLHKLIARVREAAA
jgi:hypothetical protein